jgi:hypothetical protein
MLFLFSPEGVSPKALKLPRRGKPEGTVCSYEQINIIKVNFKVNFHFQHLMLEVNEAYFSSLILFWGDICDIIC